MTGNLLIGTSGYDHPELKGSFYPADLARKDFLTFYSTRFNALELNTTFYGMPDQKRIMSFYERAEGRLKFSVKMNRLLTHEIHRNWTESAEEFKTALLPLMEKNCLASVLIQFPESFRYTDQNRIYLARLLSSLGELPAVVEFRHREWIKESVFEGLEKRNTGIVFCDMPPLKNLPDGFSAQTPFIGKNAYIRLHGRNASGWYVHNEYGEETHRYDYEYSAEELQAFVPVINKAFEENKTVQMYFNNHPKGSGFKNGLEMAEIFKRQNQ